MAFCFIKTSLIRKSLFNSQHCFNPLFIQLVCQNVFVSLASPEALDSQAVPYSKESLCLQELMMFGTSVSLIFLRNKQTIEITFFLKNLKRVRKFLIKKEIFVIDPPPYSADLSPCYCLLFSLKECFRIKFQSFK